MKKVLFYTVMSATFSCVAILDLIASVVNFIEHRYMDFTFGIGITVLATFAAGYFAGCTSRTIHKIKQSAKNPRVT
ncbi:MAG: hypothetical protein IJ545_06190 [Alphaproteobacteria bacterium]|nr:hypothetical protein [Alphaproteobacteria bacterium]